MTRDKVISIVAGLAALIGPVEKPQQAPLDKVLGRDEHVRHLVWMLGEIVSFYDAGDTEKAMRWLGYVQGACVAMGLCTIDQMRDLNNQDVRNTMSEFETGPATMFTLTASAHSIMGKRDSHEDRVLLAPDLRLFAVADGMGGHLRGEEAAQMGVDTLRAEIEKVKIPSIAALRDAIEAANGAVRAIGMGPCPNTRTGEHRLSCGCRPPGTTLTALWFGSRSVFVGHVGDCRVYRWASPMSTPEVLTQEHRMFGLIKYLGRPHQPVEPDIFEVAVEPGHTLLVGSDGLWEPLRDIPVGAERIFANALRAESLSQRVIRLISSVEDYSDDNITALLVEVGVAA